MVDNKVDDWEDLPLEAVSESDDWEDVPLTEEESLEPRATSAMGYADVKAAEKLLENTGAGQAIEKGITRAGEAVKSLPPVQKVGKGLEGITKSTLSKFGKLSPEDIGAVAEKPELYKQIKKEPGELPRKLAGVADELGEVGKTATKDLPLLMDVDKVEMPREQFLEEVKSKVVDTRREPSAKRLKQAEVAQNKLENVRKSIEKQQVKYESKVSELQAKLEEARELSKQYKEPSDKLVDAKVMKDEELKELNRRLDEFKDEIYEYDDPTASKEIRKDMEKVQRQKRKVGENLKDLTNQEKVEKVKNKKLAKKYEDRVKELQDELNQLKKQNSKDVDSLKKLSKEAEKAAESAKIKGATYSEENAKALKRLESVVDYETKLRGKDLAVAKEFSDTLYQKDGDDVRKAVRELIREKSPRAAQAMDTASTAIKDKENVQRMLGISDMEIREAGDTSTKAILPKDASSKAAQAMITEAGSMGDEATVKEQLRNALKRAGKEDLIDELELNKVAKLAQSEAGAVEAYLASKQLNPTAMRRVLSDIGTKIQEVGATGLGALKKAADSPLGKVAAKTAKAGAKMLPFIGAAADYAEAGELGIESELGKAAYTGIEQLNPLPISTGQMYEAMEKQAPMRQAAARRAMASNYGLREEPKKEITIKSLKDPELTQQTVYDLSKIGTGASQEYARRLQGIIDKRSTKEEYDRKLSMLASEPAFRKLMEKLGGSSNDDGNED